MLISKIDPTTDAPLPSFHLTVPEYAELMGLSKQAVYDHLLKVTLELKRVVITLRDSGSKSYRRLGMFRECEFDNTNPNGQRVIFEFEDRLDAHLRDFAGNFTYYQVRQIKRLKSQYSIRLYELLRKSHPLKSSSSTYKTVNLDELKLMIGATKKTYQVFSDFRKYILETAQSELSDKTDLTFDFESVRKGRKIGAIKFIIRHNRKMALPEQDADIPALEQTLEDQLKAYFPDNILALVQDEFDSGRIERNLQYVQEQQSLGSVDIKHPGKYLLKAIKEDYAKPPESKSTIDKLLDTSWDVDD